ncbi:MAG TPA: VOC family protein [Rubrobacter sp.]|nr:VOC family protein [Rubrobacter sp.]
MHAEIAFGGGVVMIGTGEPPAEGDAAATSPTGHGVNVAVNDVDAHHGRAKAADARIVYGPEDTDFGTRRYRALDPEGYEWSFGTCRPSA